MTFNLRRRTFLIGLGAFAGCTTTQPPGALQLPDSAWNDLKRRLNGRLLQPGDPEFDETAQPQNLRYAGIRPRGIAQCEIDEDIATCVTWANRNRVHPVVRAGGHSYAGYSTTRSLLIDVRAMKSIATHAQIPSLGADEVRIGAGVLNGPLYAALDRIGATITHGRCTNVGAAGFLLGGGIGFNMRHLGIGSDRLVATDLVRADGTHLTASGKENSDAFWACRGGGGGNFGVNTSFTLKIEQVPSSICVFNLTWSNRPDAVLSVLLAVLKKATTRLGSKVAVNAVTAAQRAAGQDCKVTLLGQLRGPAAELAAILAPVYAIARPDPKGKPDQPHGVHTMSYWKGQAFLEEEGPPAYYQERSRFFGGDMSDVAVKAAFAFARRLPAPLDGCDFKLFQTGGNVNALRAEDTAFVHRSSDWLFDVEANWTDKTPQPEVDNVLAWQTAFHDAMGQFLPNQSYQNFADPSLGPTDWQAAYYGMNYPKLQAVKKDLDRDSLFQFAQGIQPA